MQRSCSSNFLDIKSLRQCGSRVQFYLNWDSYLQCFWRLIICKQLLRGFSNKYTIARKVVSYFSGETYAQQHYTHAKAAMLVRLCVRLRSTNHYVTKGLKISCMKARKDSMEKFVHLKMGIINFLVEILSVLKREVRLFSKKKVAFWTFCHNIGF